MTETKTESKKIDYLTEDADIFGQKWVCLSFLSPEGIKNCTMRGLKIRGVFSEREEADKHAKELQKTDPDFHVFVGEVGKWLPWDPSPDSEKDVKEQHYHEDKLNDLMKGYKENREKAKAMYNERKDDLLKSARKLTRKEQIQSRLKQKAEQLKAQNPQDSQTNAKTDMPPQPPKKTKEQLEMELREIEETEKKFKELSEELNKQKSSVITEMEKK